MPANLKRSRRNDSFYAITYFNSDRPRTYSLKRVYYTLPTFLLFFGFLCLWSTGYNRTRSQQQHTIQANLKFTPILDTKPIIEQINATPSYDDDTEHESLFYGDLSITAVLPITQGSVEQIQETLEPLFAEESSLANVILLVPPKLRSLVENVLNGIDSALSDIEISPWSDNMDEYEAILEAFSRVQSDYALVMDHTALKGLDIETQDRLLVHPYFVDLPEGPCGGLLSLTNSTCLIPSAEPQEASFILPPFLSPTTLLKNFTEHSRKLGLKGWPSFGEWTAGIHATAGIVRGPGDSTISGCIARCAASNLTVDEEYMQLQRELEDYSATGSILASQSNHPNVVIVLPTIHDLESFSPAACKMFQGDTDIHILILSSSNEPDNETPHTGTYPWLHDQRIYHGCRLSFSSLHSSANEHANAEAASYWLSFTVTMDSIIIYGISGADYRIFDAELDKATRNGATLIKLPVDDLNFTDWMGSLEFAELKRWHEPKVEISIVTDDRPRSLHRLLASLNKGVFFGDMVNVRINMEQTSSQDTVRIVSEFDWKFGALFIHHRVVHGGLLPAVTESWYPHSNDSYGIILEDDTEVSPLFYAWAKMALLRYRYGRSTNRSPSLFGISLYQQKNLELRLEGRRPFDARSLFDSHGFEYRNTPFLSQIPCSWGAVYFPEHWREFHSYLILRFSEFTMPLGEMVVPHVRSNRWTRSWKKFFIELAYLRGYVMLYPNYDNYLSLSTNHLELGSHVKQLPKDLYERKKELFTLPLLQPVNTTPVSATETGTGARNVGLLDLPLGRLPAWRDLPILDLVGLVSSSRQLVTRGMQRQRELSGCDTLASGPTRRLSFEVQDLFSCET